MKKYFSSIINNPLRYEILKLLNTKPLSLKEIIEEFRLSYNKASLILYHLKNLQNEKLVEKINRNKYSITASGKLLLKYIAFLEEFSKNLNEEEIYVIKTYPSFSIVKFSNFLNSLNSDKFKKGIDLELTASRIKEFLIKSSKQIINEESLIFLLNYISSHQWPPDNIFENLIVKTNNFEEFLLDGKNGLIFYENLIKNLTLQYVCNTLLNEIRIPKDFFVFLSIPNLDYFINGLLCLYYPFHKVPKDDFSSLTNEIIQLVLLQQYTNYKDLHVSIILGEEYNYETSFKGILTFMQLITEYLKIPNIILSFSFNNNFNNKLLSNFVDFFASYFNDKLVYPNLFFLKLNNGKDTEFLSSFNNLFKKYPYLRLVLCTEKSDNFSLTSYGFINEKVNIPWGVPIIATINLVNVTAFKNYNEDKILSYLINLIENIYKIFMYKNTLLKKSSIIYNKILRNNELYFFNYYLNLCGFYESIFMITNKSIFNDSSAFNLANKILRTIIEVLKEYNLKYDFSVKLSQINDTVSFKNKPFNDDLPWKNIKILRNIKLYGPSHNLTPDWYAFANLKEKIKNELRLLKYFEGGFSINLPIEFDHVKIDEIVVMAYDCLVKSPLKHLILDVYSLFTFCIECKIFFEKYHLRCPKCKSFNLKYLSMQNNQLQFFSYNESDSLIKKHYYIV